MLSSPLSHLKDFSYSQKISHTPQSLLYFHIAPNDILLYCVDLRSFTPVENFIRSYWSQPGNSAGKQDLQCSREWRLGSFCYTLGEMRGDKDDYMQVVESTVGIGLQDI